MTKKYDVVGVGNALLDIILEVEESVLVSHKLKKGGMHLVTSSKSQKIFSRLKKYKKTALSGGSAANTLSGIGLLGGRGLFFGSVGDDAYGATYEKELAQNRVSGKFLRHSKNTTGVALTLITPDGERTFMTTLGAARHLHQKHIIEEDIQNSKILHIEGFLLEDKKTYQAMMQAIFFARKHATLVSIDLSSADIIMRRKSLIKNLLKKYVDIVFVNEEEAYSLTGKKELKALKSLSAWCDIVVVKLGSRGSLVGAFGKVYTIAPYHVKVVNTNGAGDMYAAAFLHGIAKNFEIHSVGKAASFAAALAVASPGARIHETHHKKLKRIHTIYSQKKSKKL